MITSKRALVAAIILAWMPLAIGVAYPAVWNWSTTASSNASSDPQINWREGMAPSAVNDSARAMMAALAGYRDDISGSLATTGTSTAYLVSTNQILPSTPTDGQLLAITVSATSGLSPTLSADGGGSYPIQSAPGAAVSAGTLVAGTPYSLKFSVANSAWMLRDFYGNPLNIPLAAGIDYWGSTLPNSNYAFAAGQAISRTTYAALFAIMGTAYGPGDGSTTFNLPDKTGRVTAMVEATATRLTSGFFGGNSTLLGSTGGSQANALVSANLPPIALSVSGTVTVTSSVSDIQQTATTLTPPGGGTSTVGVNNPGPITSSGSATLTGSAGGSSSSFAIVQPTIITNYIIRIN